MPEISVCICTFRRPVLLHHLLNAILYQQGDPASIQVVVVDNDPRQSAAEILAAYQERFGERLSCLSLGVANISLARNAAIGAATGDWIVLVDDDEIPGLDWLQSLMRTQHESGADVVFAPVVPAYAPEVPEWIREGGYFERRRMDSGTPVDHRDARSGNVLIRRAVLNSLNRLSGPFDPAYGTTGGEDSMLFRQLARAGARMVWCDQAPVFELIPAERARAGWLVQRSYRTGQLFMRTELAVLSGKACWLRGAYLSARALGQLVLAGVFAVVLAPVKPLRAFAWLRTASSQVGKLSYLSGRLAHAYGEPQQDS